MKKIDFFFNVLHFCFYRIHYKLHLFANKINPFWLLAKLPFFQRRYKKLGIDIHKEVDKAFSDKVGGLSIMVAGGVLLAVLFFFFLTTIIILNGLIGPNVGLSAMLFVVCGALSAAASYFYVFRKDKYLHYFNRFEKWSKYDMRKYSCITLGFVLAVFCLFVFSFRYVGS